MRGRFLAQKLRAGGTCLHGLMVNPPLTVISRVGPQCPIAVDTNAEDFSMAQ